MKYINSKNKFNKVLSKTNVALILSLLSIPFIQNATAQEVCDSTCVKNKPMVRPPLQTKQSINQLTYPGNDYKVSYEYKTEICPVGYRGRDGTAGFIYESRYVINFVDGKQVFGEWIALQDNCEVIPPYIPVTPGTPGTPGTAPPGEVGGVGMLKINIGWAGDADVDFSLIDPRGIGYGYYAVGGNTGCRYDACWDLDNRGQINAPNDFYNRQENVYYPSSKPLGRYVISLYRFSGGVVGGARVSVTAVFGNTGMNQVVYMPEGFNWWVSYNLNSNTKPYPTKVIIDLYSNYFKLYLQ